MKYCLILTFVYLVLVSCSPGLSDKEVEIMKELQQMGCQIETFNGIEINGEKGTFMDLSLTPNEPLADFEEAVSFTSRLVYQYTDLCQQKGCEFPDKLTIDAPFAGNLNSSLSYPKFVLEEVNLIKGTLTDHMDHLRKQEFFELLLGSSLSEDEITQLTALLEKESNDIGAIQEVELFAWSHTKDEGQEKVRYTFFLALERNGEFYPLNLSYHSVDGKGVLVGVAR